MKSLWLVFFVVYALIAPATQAEILFRHSGDGVLNALATRIGMTNMYDVTITVSSLGDDDVAFVTVYSDDSDIVMDCNLRAYGPDDQVGKKPIMIVSFSGSDLVETGAIESLESIAYLPPPAETRGANITVAEIRLDENAGTGRIGNAAGSTSLEAPKFGLIFCRELTADIGPPVGFSPDNITLIDVDGDMTGNVEADDLTALLVEGDIGPNEQSENVQIDVDGDLTTLNASSVYADVNVDGNVRDFKVYGSGDDTTEATDAVFDGELYCDTMNNGGGLRIWGDLEATVNISDRMDSIGSRIAVGREMSSDSTITIGSGGMERGITIGWMPSATGLWNGDITVNSKLLTPTPDYTQTGVGGGAVGLAPYGLHKQESVPAYTGSTRPVIQTSNTGTAVTLELVHYGYILHDVVAPAKPFEVKYAPGPNCTGSNCFQGVAQDDTTNWDLATTDPFPTTGDTKYRVMKLEGTAYEGRHYHVFVDEKLRSWDCFPDGALVKTKPYTYTFYAE